MCDEIISSRDHNDVRERLRVAVKCSRLRAYELARLVGVSGSVLSNWITGARPCRPDDPRVQALAAHLGVPLPTRTDGSGRPSAYTA